MNHFFGSKKVIITLTTFSLFLGILTRSLDLESRASPESYVIGISSLVFAGFSFVLSLRNAFNKRGILPLVISVAVCAVNVLIYLSAVAKWWHSYDVVPALYR